MQQKIEDGKSEMTGLCMECAKKMGIPVMDELMKQVDLNPDDMDNLSKQMNHMFQDMELDSSDEENPLMNLMKMNFSEDESSDPFVQEVKEDIDEEVEEKPSKGKKKPKV